MILNVDQIKVEERIRTEADSDDESDELMQSLVSLGQLQPIVVTKLPDANNGAVYKLQVGERRLRAIKKLNENGKSPRYLEIGQIKAELFGELSSHVQLMIEFDENVKRKDFSFIEKAKFIRRFHETMEAQTDGKWTDPMTAASLRISPMTIGRYLRIEEAMKTDPLVSKATTLRSAIKRMKVTEQTRARQIEAKESKDVSVNRAANMFLFGDAISLVKNVANESIDFINFDPPWGDDTGFKSNANWEGFDDDTATSDRIIDILLPELYRVLKNDRIMAFWYRAWAYEDMVSRLENAGFNLKFVRTPCIWYKPDKVSDQNRFPEKQLIASYETFLLARKGEPLLHDRNRMNVFVYDRTPRAALIHPTEKPLALCDALLKICTVPGEMVLDPTAGSAAMLHSALRMDRKILGFELGQEFYDRGLLRLIDFLELGKGKPIGDRQSRKR